MSDHLSAHVACQVRLCCSDVTIIPDLGNHFHEYNIVIIDGNDGQNCKNKTQVIINQTYPLISLDATEFSSMQFLSPDATQVKLARSSEMSDHMSSMSLDCRSKSITAYYVHTQNTLLFPVRGSSVLKCFEVSDNLNFILEPVNSGCQN